MKQDENNSYIFYNEETVLGDGIEYLPGWYFRDETWDLNGPYDTRDEAIQMLDTYAENL